MVTPEIMYVDVDKILFVASFFMKELANDIVKRS